jgi:hypothetical protein
MVFITRAVCTHLTGPDRRWQGRWGSNPLAQVFQWLTEKGCLVSRRESEPFVELAYRSRGRESQTNKRNDLVT